MDLAVVTLTKLHFSEGGQLNREMRKRVQTSRNSHPPQQETMLADRDVKCLNQGRYIPGTWGRPASHGPARTYLLCLASSNSSSSLPTSASQWFLVSCR